MQVDEEDSLPASVGKLTAAAVWTSERARPSVRVERGRQQPEAVGEGEQELERRAALDSVPAGDWAAEGEEQEHQRDRGDRCDDRPLPVTPHKT